MYKLPIINIIVEAFWYPWKYKLQFLNALALPVALIVGISTVWSELAEYAATYNWYLYILYSLSVSFFAVRCHRFILLGIDKQELQLYTLMLKRITIFSVWAIAIYIAAGIPLAVIMTIAANITTTDNVVSSSHNLTADNFNWVKLLVMIPFGYFVGRFSLVLPATAIDIRSSFRWSWQTTKDNGMRMLVLIGVLPWLTTILLDLLWREDGTMFEYVFLSIIGYFVVAIEIFILSIAFREFKRIENLNSN